MDLILSPDYNRDYKTAEEVQAAWDENQDFRILTPEYENWIRINKTEFFFYRSELMPEVTAVKIRFNYNQALLNITKED